MLGAVKEAHLAARGSRAPAQMAQGEPAPTQTMRSHTDSLLAIAFFKDGRRVVTGSHDKTLRICDMQKGSLIGGPFEGHQDWVRSVAVSPDDRRIASSGDDKTIIIWDIESKQMVFDPLDKHTGWVLSVCFSPDGKRLASGSHDKSVMVWDAETGAVLATLDGHSNSVWSVAFSPDGLKLASGSADHSIRIWSADNAELLLDIDAHQHWVRSVVWSPDGQQLVSASFDKTVKFWSSEDGDQIGRTCTGPTTYHSLAISSDGSFIATASDDKTLRLWSTKTHRLIRQVLEHAAWIRCVAISPNGELLVSGDGEGKVLLCSIKNILEQHKTEEWITEDEEAEQLHIIFSDAQLRSYNCPSNHTSELDEASGSDDEASCSDDEAPGSDDKASGSDEETSGSDDEASDSDDEASCSDDEASDSNDEAPGSDDEHSWFDILSITPPLHSASLHTAEELLTQEINADDNNHVSYANRSVIRARNFEWEDALRDAAKSIAIQPSLLGYISKGIALCGNEQLWDAMEAFDLAFIFSNRNPSTVDLLLLIKAVALFNAGRYDEAIRRVQDLATAHKHPDPLPCNIVNSYLCAQLATIDFENEQYSKAADQLTTSLTSFLSHKTVLEPRLKIFTVLFGWDLDSFWRSVNQRRCDAFLRAGRVVEAVEALQYMIDGGGKDTCLEWSTTFKQECIARCVAEASDHEMAVELYSAAIMLDSSSECLFAHRSKANLERNLCAEALHDAEKVIELNPLSYLGYEVKLAALDKARRHDEALEAFNIMISKSDYCPDHIQKLRQQYISPCEVEDTILQTIHAHLENAPLRLLNTSTGRLCNREAQIHAFMESTEYKQLLYPHAPLQTELITETVAKYFSRVMLSHRWERKEPLLHDIEDKGIYDLHPVGTILKLQAFCKIARDAGYRWAWSDTCCIDQKNKAELQRSVNSMFVWYRQSALTIVYLSDVHKSGALANSAWNTRGWTVQELLAPVVILFYRADWSLYRDDCELNHKKCAVIMKELQDSTGIDVQSLVAFCPGTKDAREILQWASSRATTLEEDTAYSLFGIFGIDLPVIYGETKQNALGRLLQEIVARSGDITALDWIGKPSQFNSCLPSDITSYKAPPSICMVSSLPEDEMQVAVSKLRSTVAAESASALYTLLDSLGAPRFENSRLHLPCIVFPVTEVRRRSGQNQTQETCFTFNVKADGLQDFVVTTEDRLVQFSRARPTQQTFLLVRPWSRYDLGLPDFADTSVRTLSVPWSMTDHKRVDEERLGALRLMVRLGQAFGGLLMAQQRGGEYRRIASDCGVVARVKDVAAVHDMMDIRTLEIL